MCVKFAKKKWVVRIEWMTDLCLFDFQIGKKQHFELGQFFRRRYQNLLGTEGYQPELVYVQSTDVDRTLMSALANLAGLFPPTASQMWNENVLWQPIPVHTIPESLDYTLAAKRSCPKYEFALKKLNESDEFLALYRRFKPLIDFLSKNTGKEIRTFADVQSVYNTLYIEELKNYT